MERAVPEACSSQGLASERVKGQGAGLAGQGSESKEGSGEEAELGRENLTVVQTKQSPWQPCQELCSRDSH